MKYRIGHYYGKEPPVPEAVEIDRVEGRYASGDPTGEFHGVYEVEIEDLNAFVEKHGPIILSPPGKRPYESGWWIWVTD